MILMSKVASNLTVGEELVKDKNLDQNIPFFRDMFEVNYLRISQHHFIDLCCDFADW
jgi:hypothetical protein